MERKSWRGVAVRLRELRIAAAAGLLDGGFNRAICMRLDDKLSRIARGQVAGEDVTLDLIGYLVLLRVADKAVALKLRLSLIMPQTPPHRIPPTH